MNLLTFFEIFLLLLSFYSIANFTGASKYTVPLACLFCIFWVQRLEKKMKEEEDAKRRLLQHRLEKHYEAEEESRHRGHRTVDVEE